MNYPYVIKYKSKRTRFKPMLQREDVEVIDMNSGEVKVASRIVGREEQIDTSSFVKLYEPKMLMKLSRVGLSVFCYVMDVLRYDSYITFNYNDCMEYTGHKTRKSVYNGLQELLSLEFLKEKGDKQYYVNPNIIYKGNRNKLKI